LRMLQVISWRRLRNYELLHQQNGHANVPHSPNMSQEVSEPVDSDGDSSRNHIMELYEVLNI
jgi:hypothetical protein